MLLRSHGLARALQRSSSALRRSQRWFATLSTTISKPSSSALSMLLKQQRQRQQQQPLRRGMSFLNLFADDGKQAATTSKPKPAASTSSSSSSSSSSTTAEGKHFDLFIIGGGSGGLALSREAAWLGARVGLADYVDPSAHGSTWGLGGTCVNVGCIPKKLYHTAAVLGDHVHDAQAYGWEFPKPSTGSGSESASGSSSSSSAGTTAGPTSTVKPHLNWQTLRDNIRAHISSSNFVYRVRLQGDGIDYYNARASFVDANTVLLTRKDGSTERVTAKHIAVVVGGRPRPLDIPGGDLAITSDDIFTLPKAPGKTLVIGGSYVALECAGFLSGLGYDTTVMARSIFLRGFDQQMAEMIVSHMATPPASQAHAPTRFLRARIPVSMKRDPTTRRIRVKFAPVLEGGKPDLAKVEEEVYDTVLSAVGRDPYLQPLELSKVGVNVHEKSGKVVVDRDERTNVPNIFALGDCVHGGLELTPVAIRAGKLLARRLFGHPSHADPTKPAATTTASTSAAASSDASLNQHLHMRYDTSVPTTVFTPLEYGCVGLSEESALAAHGAARVEVYHTHFQPLEWAAFTGRPGNSGYCKVITLLPEGAAASSASSSSSSSSAAKAPAANKPAFLSAMTADESDGGSSSDGGAASAAQNAHGQYWRTAHRERVLGIHYLGPNAGEVVQGYAVALRNGTLTRADLEETIAIHPTTAEELLLLNITKRSGVDPKKVGCCG